MAVTSEEGESSVPLASALKPGTVVMAAEFQNIELISPPAAVPAKSGPWKSAKCSRTANPPALAWSAAPSPDKNAAALTHASRTQIEFPISSPNRRATARVRARLICQMIT